MLFVSRRVASRRVASVCCVLWHRTTRHCGPPRPGVIGSWPNATGPGEISRCRSTKQLPRRTSPLLAALSPGEAECPDRDRGIDRAGTDMTNAKRLGLIIFVIAACGCARQQMRLELHASIMYEKPRISEISYRVDDSRREGGDVVVEVSLRGDTGLEASFDISPGVTERESMTESEDGRYVGRFVFPRTVVGGPYTITGRLRHEEAGEVILKDSTPLTIPMFR